MFMNLKQKNKSRRKRKQLNRFFKNLFFFKLLFFLFLILVLLKNPPENNFHLFISFLFFPKLSLSFFGRFLLDTCIVIVCIFRHTTAQAHKLNKKTNFPRQQQSDSPTPVHILPKIVSRPTYIQYT